MRKEDFKIDCIMDGTFRITRQDVPGDLHTHVKSRKLANTIINNVCNGKIPTSSRNYTLISMYRLSDDGDYQNRITEILETRKKKGRKEKYYNNNKKF